MQVHEAIAAALLEHHVDTVFGLMGDANMRVIRLAWQMRTPG